MSSRLPLRWAKIAILAVFVATLIPSSSEAGLFKRLRSRICSTKRVRTFERRVEVRRESTQSVEPSVYIPPPVVTCVPAIAPIVHHEHGGTIEHTGTVEHDHSIDQTPTPADPVPSPILEPAKESSAEYPVIYDHGVSVDRRSSVLTRINRLRAAAGLGGLVWDGGLESTAQRWSNQMARARSMYHSNWNIRENVAYGGRGTDFMKMWRESKGHYRNMVNPNISRVAVATATNGRTEYATMHLR